MSTANEPRWDDPSWRIASDSDWQAGLRWLESRWRAVRLELAAGPFREGEETLVGSTLSADAPPDANFLSPEAASSARRRLDSGGGGLISEDRLRRNLLSSQPMCFNLFGHFQNSPDDLLPWVRHIDAQATAVNRIEVEWAPPPEEHFQGGSAFDAFVEYERESGGLGFLGVECKYHEDLKKSDVKHVREVYKDFTRESGRWSRDAAVRLDASGLRQFWLNTLLAQSLVDGGDRYEAGHCVITSCAADRSARESFLAVRAELEDHRDLVWQPWEAVVASIDDESWTSAFVDRYLDFEPVRHSSRNGRAPSTFACWRTCAGRAAPA